VAVFHTGINTVENIDVICFGLKQGLKVIVFGSAKEAEGEANTAQQLVKIF